MRSDARITIEFSILNAIADSALQTGLTADKCGDLVRKIVEQVFSKSTIWSVQEYLDEKKKEENN